MKRNINLSPLLQKNWVDKTTKNIFKLLIIFLCLIGLLLCLNFYQENRKSELSVITQQFIEQQEQLKSAGISVIRFYVDQGLKLKIAGTYQHQQDFEELEDFFKESGFSVNIEYLQSNNKAKADFSIIVYKESK